LVLDTQNVSISARRTAALMVSFDDKLRQVCAEREVRWDTDFPISTNSPLTMANAATGNTAVGVLRTATLFVVVRVCRRRTAALMVSFGDKL
jgi:hypothetical protein